MQCNARQGKAMQGGRCAKSYLEAYPGIMLRWEVGVEEAVGGFQGPLRVEMAVQSGPWNQLAPCRLLACLVPAMNPQIQGRVGQTASASPENAVRLQGR
jgi:hypothetical protein